MFRVMAKKAGGKPFEVFTGTEHECMEKLIALNMDKAAGVVVAGLNLRDYEFYGEGHMEIEKNEKLSS